MGRWLRGISAPAVEEEGDACKILLTIQSYDAKGKIKLYLNQTKATKPCQTKQLSNLQNHSTLPSFRLGIRILMGQGWQDISSPTTWVEPNAFDYNDSILRRATLVRCDAWASSFC